MACGCGKKKTFNEVSRSVQTLKTRGSTEAEIVKEATDGEEFIYAIYNGPNYPHYLPSPTGVISQYGILNYGMGKRGDRIKVHKLDFEKSNGRLFLPVPDQGEEEMANNGNEGIRGVEPTDTNYVSNEARSNQKVNAEIEKASKAEARKAARAAKAAQQEAESTATQDTDDAQNDLVALANAQAVETNQATPSEKQEQLNTTDANQDNVPDEQQRRTTTTERTRKSSKSEKNN
jgi:hypothetical protein